MRGDGPSPTLPAPWRPCGSVPRGPQPLAFGEACPRLALHAVPVRGCLGRKAPLCCRAWLTAHPREVLCPSSPGVSQWQGCDPGWALLACTLAGSLLSCPPLCDRVDCSPPGPSVHGISQARVLEWVAISSPRGSSRPMDQTHVSCISCQPRRSLNPSSRSLELSRGLLPGLGSLRGLLPLEWSCPSVKGGGGSPGPPPVARSPGGQRTGSW